MLDPGFNTGPQPVVTNSQDLTESSTTVVVRITRSMDLHSPDTNVWANLKGAAHTVSFCLLLLVYKHKPIGSSKCQKC